MLNKYAVCIRYGLPSDIVPHFLTPVRSELLSCLTSKDLVNAINNLRTDIASVRELRAKMDQAVQDTIIATRIIDASRNPGQQQGSVYLKNYANFPLECVTFSDCFVGLCHYVTSEIMTVFKNDYNQHLFRAIATFLAPFPKISFHYMNGMTHNYTGFSHA